MQGRGITNYDSSKPSHELTTSTTQFDDELMKRGIVTMEQVMLAKGATPEEAQRLVEQAKKKKNSESLPTTTTYYDISVPSSSSQGNDENDDDDDSDDYLLEEDDELFERYRQERIAAAAQQQSTTSTSSSHHGPIRITRDEWKIHVNEASQTKWILVILWDDTTMRNQDIMQDLMSLLQEQSSSWMNIVTIPYQEANPHWPSTRVPAIFAYKDGIKQHEFVTTKAGKFPTPEQLRRLLLEEWKLLS